MAPKALGRRQQAQADKEASVLIKGVGTICAEADDGELEYVTDRLKNNKNLLQRFRHGVGDIHFFYSLHEFLVRLACIPPRRLSSLLKKETLVALLDGSSDAAQSQVGTVEKEVVLPSGIKKFKHLTAYPKLVDKIMMRLDVKRFFESELKHPQWTMEAKMGVIYMYLKETPESLMPSTYIEELKAEKVFFAAVSQISSKNVDAAKLSVEDLKKGFYRVDGNMVEWPWANEGDDSGATPKVCLEDMGKTITVVNPFDIDSIATATTAAGRVVKSEPLRQMFEGEGVDFAGYGQQWIVKDGTYIMSPAAKRKAAKMTPPGRASPKKKRKKTNPVALPVGNVSEAIMNRINNAGSSSSSSRQSAQLVLSGSAA